MERTTTGVGTCGETAQASFGCRVQETTRLASGVGVCRKDGRTGTARRSPAIRGTGTARGAYSRASTATPDGRNRRSTTEPCGSAVRSCPRMPKRAIRRESHTMPRLRAQTGGAQQTHTSGRLAQSTKVGGIREAVSASTTTCRRRTGGTRRSRRPAMATAARPRPAFVATGADAEQRL